MNRKPRKVNESIINLKMFARLFIVGFFMAAMALYLFQIGKTTYASSQVGQTMALVSLSLMNIFVALNLQFTERNCIPACYIFNSRLVYTYSGLSLLES